MAKQKQPKPNQLKDRNSNIQEPNTYLETQKAHKNWYNVWEMGKQRGKPKAVPPNIRKEKGSRHRSLRKER